MPNINSEEIRDPIRLADTQYQTIWITNEIAKFIIENGYDFPVETVEMTVEETQLAIVFGQIDVILEYWPTGDMGYFNKT